MFCSWAYTVTRALPVLPITTTTDGPEVARSVKLVLVVVWLVAT